MSSFDLWLLIALIAGALVIDFFQLALQGRGPVPWLVHTLTGKESALDDRS